MINLMQPRTGAAELEAVREVFESKWLGAGERVKRFERQFASYIGRPVSEVLAVNSCTEGLFQIVASLGLDGEDEVVLPTVSFIGAAHAVREAGARVVLCDVDARTLNPTVENIEQVLTPSTKAVLILHYGGNPGVVAEIAELAQERNLILVEDAACSLGSFVGDGACGTFGDLGVWSFDAVKLLTTGDGGMIWSRSEEMADRIRRHITLGVGSSGLQRSGVSRWWEIDPSTTGRRATMNDVAAAIGLEQLGQVPEFLRRRAEIAEAYDSALADIAWLETPAEQPCDGARFYYWIQAPQELRDRLSLHLLERGVYTNFRYWPLHRTRLYACDRVLPGADRATDSTLLLPVHQGLTNREMESVVEAIHDFEP